MRNRAFLVLLRPIFAQKMKTAPRRIWVPKLWRSCRDSTGRTVLISDFVRKIRLNSVKTFFLEITCFWAAKPFDFPTSAKKAVSISDKPFESDSRAMKIRVKVAYSCLTLSKKPLLFEILATRLGTAGARLVEINVWFVSIQTRLASRFHNFEYNDSLPQWKADNPR